MIVYISIGNSDDKLTQFEWSMFVGRIDLDIQRLVNRGDVHVHGRWFAAPDVPWQSGCWCVEVLGTTEYADTSARRLRKNLASLAREFDQDSIAWAEAPHTEFIRAAAAAGVE